MGRLQNFKVSESDGVEEEKIGGLVEDERRERADMSAEVLGEVMKNGASGTDCGGAALESEPVEGGDTEVFEECELRGVWRKGPIFVIPRRETGGSGYLMK